MRRPRALPLLLLLSACCGAAQAQMYHLYLICEGTVAAGPGASSPAQTAVTPRGAGAQGRSVEGVSSDASDKNRAEGDENSQARTRAVRSALKRGDAHLELALRDNNMSMLVQRSNVLPTGQTFGYQATPTHYSASYQPQQQMAAFRDWGGTGFFAFYPPFQKMQAMRFSIDRQSGVLQGDIVGPDGALLGLVDLQCEPRRPEDAPRPRF